MNTHFKEQSDSVSIINNKYHDRAISNNLQVFRYTVLDNKYRPGLIIILSSLISTHNNYCGIFYLTNLSPIAIV